MPNYSYPIDSDWSVAEMDIVIRLLNAVEAAYESQVSREQVLTCYAAFKKVIPSKMEEKQLGKQFEKKSGYSIYQTVKKAKEAKTKTIQMKG